MAQNTAIVGGNVSGNISSCEIKATYVSSDSWHTQQIAVNSCNGEVVYNSGIYFDYSYIFVPLAICFVIIVGAIGIRIISD